ncbi:hypothetical protein FNW02_37245 [Komarekiella sp. 'clone 1']|uniref:Uncharacterized protein n=1 Tax=Komarekiella delphini-convector SJRDD-AB1 TaxID=2593771 RepID=A0AA40VVS2_9NOST|nr:hypothetical protein [Komarekiella delphini-convector SJRDD-AB1]
MEYLSVKECRSLLRIQSKDTINKYLKTLNLFGQACLSWSEIKQVLELQIFLGLKHGRNSKSIFRQMTRQQLDQTFKSYGVDVDARLAVLQKIHKGSVPQKLVYASSCSKK